MARPSRGDNGPMSCPSNRMEPALGLWMPAIVLPIVVLPQPDSPTMPRISPRATESETPSTARNHEARRPHALKTGKSV